MNATRAMAIFSDDRKYRYTLWRSWSEEPVPFGGYAMFIGLNPSTADETEDDPTIRRCIGFAKSWGYGGLCMCNLFAFRATEPSEMKKIEHPLGSQNDKYLVSSARGSGVVVAAWGNSGDHLDRNKAVISLIPDLHYLRLTKAGHPAHPLYLPKILQPIRWEPTEEAPDA